MSGRLRVVLAVLRKELLDAMRDRRTLITVFVTSVLMGPLVLMAVSVLFASLEERAEQRVVYISGLDDAPSLRNFFARQTYTVKAAPADYEAQLRRSTFSHPVVVVPPDFETALVQGDAPVVEVVADSANTRSQAGVASVARLLNAFGRERVALTLALRGVSARLLEPIQVEDRDLASTQTRSTRITGILPYFVLMAVLYGALNAALDATAGERERGSLEPLLMNPPERWTLVVGKWGAVAAVSMLIAVLSTLSFLPGQWLLRSDTLAAMFQYGPAEAMRFLVVLLPFAAMVSAVLMAVAIRCRSFKEAQASATIVVLGVSLMPLVSFFKLGGEAPWHLWVPALAQNTLMTRVLKGEGLDLAQWLVPSAVCVLLTVAAIAYVGRMLRVAAVQ